MTKTDRCSPRRRVAALMPPRAAAQGAPAGDAAKGRQKIQMCQGCHGIEGWRTAYPGGLHACRGSPASTRPTS